MFGVLDVNRRSVCGPGFGTNPSWTEQLVGENGLHPEYVGILDDLAARGVKTSITSNGLSVHTLDDARLARFHSVELSLDFPSEAEHDGFRGPGNWRTVVAALERCTSLGVPVTITAVMMTINYRRLPALARVAAAFSANLRVNVYQPSRTDRFTLSYDQLWDGFRGLAAATRLVATTEPDPAPGRKRSQYLTHRYDIAGVVTRQGPKLDRRLIWDELTPLLELKAAPEHADRLRALLQQT